MYKIYTHQGQRWNYTNWQRKDSWSMERTWRIPIWRYLSWVIDPNTNKLRITIAHSDLSRIQFNGLNYKRILYLT